MLKQQKKNKLTLIFCGSAYYVINRVINNYNIIDWSMKIGK